VNVYQFQRHIFLHVKSSSAGFMTVEPREAPQGFRPDRFRCNFGLKLKKMPRPGSQPLWVFARDDASLEIGISYAEELMMGMKGTPGADKP